MKISAHVVTYSGMLAIGTLVAYSVSYSFGKDDKTKQRELDEKYSSKQLHKVPGNRQVGANHDEMQKFFDKLKKPEHEDIDHKLDDLMKKGRGEMKRHHNYYNSNDPNNNSSSSDKT